MYCSSTSSIKCLLLLLFVLCFATVAYYNDSMPPEIVAEIKDWVEQRDEPIVDARLVEVKGLCVTLLLCSLWITTCGMP